MKQTNKDLIEKARSFGKEKHEGQVRKYTGEPYFNHCEEVLSILMQYDPSASVEAQAAALLHDTVEDTDTSFKEIYETFGEIVFQYVFFLTDCSKSGDGNRGMRKRIDRLHLTSCTDINLYAIKCADLISNTSSIVDHDPKFAKVYLKEKQQLLNEMKQRLPLASNLRIYQKALELACNNTEGTGS